MLPAVPPPPLYNFSAKKLHMLLFDFQQQRAAKWSFIMTMRLGIR
jgi:hypothetical protein